MAPLRQVARHNGGVHDDCATDASTQTYDAVPAATCAATAAPAPVFENVAPTQQLPPVYTTTTVTTDGNLDITGWVNPQFSSSAPSRHMSLVLFLLWKSLLSP